MQNARSLAIASVSFLAMAFSHPANAGNIITTSGNRILNNGTPFLPNGVIFDMSAPIALLQTYAKTYVNSFVKGRIQAYDYYFGLDDPSQGVNFTGGKDAISVMKKSWAAVPPAKAPWGINTLRFNVDEAALNATSPEYSGYVSEIKSAVSRAEAAGYVVDLALFDERDGNAPYTPFWVDNPETPLDNATTEAAAITLANLYGKDQNVIIELLNEPFPPVPLAVSWGFWANGGVDNYPGGQWYGATFVGVNAEIAAIRNAGALNAIIVQGLSFSFVGFQYNVVDPLNRVIYSVHPFPNSITPNTTTWNSEFGTVAATLPVLITAWDTNSMQAWCNSSTYDTPYNFLSYLNSLNVGVIGYGFDVPATIVKALNGNPTLWPSSCGIQGGPGQIMQRYYTSGIVPLP